MKFLSKDLALKLKDKGFDKPCFGWYYVENINIEVNLNESFGTYEDCLYSNNWDELHDIGIVDRIDAPTIEQVLEWLREERNIDIVIYPIDINTIYMGGEKYILAIYWDGKRIYKIHENNNDKFVKWEDACIAGIEYVINNLI